LPSVRGFAFDASPILAGMHTLEQEYRQLHAEQVIDEPTARRMVALDRGEIFSLFVELRFALYASVLAITTGIGLLLKNNLDRIGPVTLIVVLALIAAACYTSALRTRLRHAERSIGGDYVLLLGALILSADLGYAEAQFHWLGAHWSWHLLILAVLHAVTAYSFDSRLVLSVSLTSLAGWFGIYNQFGVDNFLDFDNSLGDVGAQGLVCASVIMAWRELHRRFVKSQTFTEIFEHFAAHTSFCGALALSFESSTRYVGIVLVIILAAINIRKGLAHAQEAFVVYGVAYAAFGLCVFEATVIADSLLMLLMELITVVAAASMLWHWHAQLKRAAE
jgi:hypothetical protein